MSYLWGGWYCEWYLVMGVSRLGAGLSETIISPKLEGYCDWLQSLSGPVLRDTVRLSQRYPHIARYGVSGVSTWPTGFDTPSPFSEPFPFGEHAKWRCDTPPPPQKGYLSDTCAIPYEKKENACDTPLCDTISKGYCAIWGGISHWAAKCSPWKEGTSQNGERRGGVGESLRLKS